MDRIWLGKRLTGKTMRVPAKDCQILRRGCLWADQHLWKQCLTSGFCLRVTERGGGDLRLGADSFEALLLVQDFACSGFCEGGDRFLFFGEDLEEWQEVAHLQGLRDLLGWIDKLQGSACFLG